MSWVTTMLVTPSRSRMRIINWSMMALVTGSRPVVGSSYMMYLGCRAMARAMPTRFLIPPESSAGYFDSTPGKSTSSSASPTRAMISLSESLPSLRSPIATLSPMVSESNSAAN